MMNADERSDVIRGLERIEALWKQVNADKRVLNEEPKRLRKWIEDTEKSRTMSCLKRELEESRELGEILPKTPVAPIKASLSEYTEKPEGRGFYEIHEEIYKKKYSDKRKLESYEEEFELAFSKCTGRFLSDSDLMRWAAELSADDYAEKRAAFISTCMEFDRQYQEKRRALKAYEEIIGEQTKRMIEQGKEASERKTAGLRESIQAGEEELKAQDLLHEDYYYLAGEVAGILRTKRKQELSDALNLAISEDRENTFRRKQLEQMEEKNRILEEQAEDEWLHNKEMRRIEEERVEAQRRTDERMARAAEEQARAAEEQARAAVRQAEAAEEQGRQLAKQANEQAKAAKAVAMCTGCSNARFCSHIGKYTIQCDNYKKFGWQIR